MHHANKLSSEFTLEKCSHPSDFATQDPSIQAQQNSSHFMEYGVNTAIDPKQALFIVVKDKIGLDQKIKHESELSDSEILEMLEIWQGLLIQHRIMVLFTEKPIDHRRRYRFLSESFFKMHLPVHPIEMQFCFIYDFAATSSPEYLNNQTISAIMQAILNNEHVEWIEQLNKRLRLNTFENLSEPEFYYIVNKYKQQSNHIINRNISVLTNKIIGNRLIYTGFHETDFCFDDHCRISKGNWQLEMVAEHGSWQVVDIQIQGVKFRV